MENQENLDIEIGTTETVTLKPVNVEVREVEIREVEIKGKKNEKVVLKCKHPDREELIEISQVKSERRGKLEVSGLWINKGKDGLLVKNSVVAQLMSTHGCRTPREFTGKAVPTVLDEKGYLAVKGY